MKSCRVKKWFSVFLAMAVLCFCLPLPVFAAENSTTDSTYYLVDITPSNFKPTGHRDKETHSEVYVCPTFCSAGYTLVQTYCYVGGAPQSKNTHGTVSLSPNVEYAIDNYVYEDGDKYDGKVEMWLQIGASMNRGMAQGKWSPDFTPYGGEIYV